jgi:YidC/Oxa1 family membrane protein insertase
MATSATTVAAESLYHLFFSREVFTMMNTMRAEFGLTWWQAITAFTIGLRFVVLPLNVSLVRNTLRVQHIQPQIDDLDERMCNKANPEDQLKAATELRQLFRDHKCHPLKNIITPFLFPPIFLSLFGAVHWLCMNEPALHTEGLLWFPDLSAPDISNALPVLSALTWLASFEARPLSHGFAAYGTHTLTEHGWW